MPYIILFKGLNFDSFHVLYLQRDVKIVVSTGVAYHVPDRIPMNDDISTCYRFANLHSICNVNWR